MVNWLNDMATSTCYIQGANAIMIKILFNYSKPFSVQIIWETLHHFYEDKFIIMDNIYINFIIF